MNDEKKADEMDFIKVIDGRLFIRIKKENGRIEWMEVRYE